MTRRTPMTNNVTRPLVQLCTAGDAAASAAVADGNITVIRRLHLHRRVRGRSLARRRLRPKISHLAFACGCHGGRNGPTPGRTSSARSPPERRSQRKRRRRRDFRLGPYGGSSGRRARDGPASVEFFQGDAARDRQFRTPEDPVSGTNAGYDHRQSTTSSRAGEIEDSIFLEVNDIDAGRQQRSLNITPVGRSAAIPDGCELDRRRTGSSTIPQWHLDRAASGPNPDILSRRSRGRAPAPPPAPSA